MSESRRRHARLCVAIAAGLSATLLDVKLLQAQQNPNDQTVFLNSSDASNASSFALTGPFNWQASNSIYSTPVYTNSAALPAGASPTSGYAYVVTGSSAGTAGVLRTPASNGSSVSFAGDSLTIIPYNGQQNLYNTSSTITNAQDTTAALSLYGTNTSSQSVTVNLVLGNGGAVINSSRNNEVLNGTINLLPTGTVLDGVTSTVNGGIVDSRSGGIAGVVINSTLSGSGQLHILATGGSSATTVSINGSNGSFTGGILLDNTAGPGQSGSGIYQILNINNPAALGSGQFTIGSTNPSGVQSVGPGAAIDNLTGADESLSTNPAQQWNGNFQFKGTNSLNMGSGAVTLGADVTLTLANNVLMVNSITGSHTLNVAGSTPVSGALEVPQLGSITTSGLVVGNGATLAFPAALNTPAQFVSDTSSSAFATAGALLGIDTTGVAGGTYALSDLPSGSYGINKLGSGTLLLGGTGSFTGFTTVSNGILMLGSSTALAGSSDLNLGSNFGGPNGTLDLNGYSVTLVQPTGGAKGGLITNSNSTPAQMTLVTATAFLPNSSYFGNISGNLSVVIAYPAITDNVTSFPEAALNGTNTYTGTTTLQSGVIAVGAATGLPTTPQNVLFNGGILYLSSGGFDPSPQFNQSAGQAYNIVVNGATTFATGLNSSGGSLTVGNLNAHLAAVGTLTLAAANHYTGPTTLNSGYLQIANPQALAGTSGVTVNGSFPNPNIVGSTASFSTLQINDSSGVVGLTGGTANGAPITLTLNGLGAGYKLVTYKTGITNHNAGTAFYGALEGIAGATDIWAGNISLGAAPVGISGGFQNASSGGILKLTGVISGTGPLVLGLNGNSTTVLAAANTYSGETQLTSAFGLPSAVQLGANYGIPADSGLNFANCNIQATIKSTFVYGSETFDLNGYNTSAAYVTSSTSNISNAIATYSTVSATSNNGIITNTNNGSTATLTILGAATAPFLGVFKDGSATAKLALDFDGGVQTLSGTNPYSGDTTVDAGTLIVSTPASSGTGNITINSAGGAILRSTSAATIFNLLQSGYAGGSWNGSGIRSTFAASDPTHLTAVGMLQPSGTTTFEGQTLNPTDVALKLTYYGDATLDGQVDASDYSRIDNGFLQGLTGWQNGDFNYDGTIDGSDYTLIDNAFNTQGAQFSSEFAVATAQIAGPTGAAAVPEPTALTLFGAAAVGLLSRRRRK